MSQAQVAAPAAPGTPVTEQRQSPGPASQLQQSPGHAGPSVHADAGASPAATQAPGPKRSPLGQLAANLAAGQPPRKKAPPPAIPGSVPSQEVQQPAGAQGPQQQASGLGNDSVSGAGETPQASVMKAPDPQPAHPSGAPERPALQQVQVQPPRQDGLDWAENLQPAAPRQYGPAWPAQAGPVLQPRQVQPPATQPGAQEPAAGRKRCCSQQVARPAASGGCRSGQRASGGG